MEHWKVIKNSNYLISDLGNVKKPNGTVVKQNTDKFGYKNVSIKYDDKYRIRRVHRLVAEHFVNKQNNSFDVVNHINEIKTDNRATNLEWCTQSYNHNYGSAIKRHILSKSQYVTLIREHDKIVAINMNILGKYFNVSVTSYSYYVYRNHKLKGYKVRCAYSWEIEKLIKEDKLLIFINN